MTRSFAPPEEDFQKYVHHIFESSQFTNNGPLLQELNEELRAFLGVRYLQFVTNGTLAIQLALRELGITEGEVITTPFTYVATTSAILWEHCEPVYVDIDPQTLCMDPNLIEAAITPQTKAILPVHVFGIPCDVDAIADIGRRYGIPVIYDAAHAFGCVYRGKSLLDYGDVSTCSFHATKLFHTIEGGCIICQDEAVSSKIHLAKQFGHSYDDHFQLGINAKASEFQAAMGLCNLPYVPRIIADRKRSVELYDAELSGRLKRPEIPAGTEYNYAYYPVIFPSEEALLRANDALEAENIHFRRYFYPSLNTLPYLSRKPHCPISEDLSRRIACLPLYYGMRSEDIRRIAALICAEVERNI
ncbi:MAG: DegT/DnrJ/EryC1/StrS family aminotransferase [Planctomycetia bacterium]|nr:DegT/DnrJ/EryC1/StrS family aminotransferase [Planctomycetia bacterium]